MLYSGYGIAFDGKSLWSFGNDFARNTVIFVVDNSTSSHADNRKNKLLVLGEDLTSGINENFGALEKTITKSLHYSGDNSYLFVDGKKFKSLSQIKQIEKMSAFYPNFVYPFHA